jgi:hypothetical protein
MVATMTIVAKAVRHRVMNNLLPISTAPCDLNREAVPPAATL